MPDWRDSLSNWVDRLVDEHSDTPVIGGLTHLLEIPKNVVNATKVLDDGFQASDLAEVPKTFFKNGAAGARTILGTLDNTIGLVAKPIIKGADAVVAPIVGEGRVSGLLNSVGSVVDPGKLVASANSIYRAAKNGRLDDLKTPWQTQGFEDEGVLTTLSELGLLDKVVTRDMLKDANDIGNAAVTVLTMGGAGAAKSALTSGIRTAKAVGKHAGAAAKMGYQAGVKSGFNAGVEAANRSFASRLVRNGMLEKGTTSAKVISPVMATGKFMPEVWQTLVKKPIAEHLGGFNGSKKAMAKEAVKAVGKAIGEMDPIYHGVRGIKNGNYKGLVKTNILGRDEMLDGRGHSLIEIPINIASALL